MKKIDISGDRFDWIDGNEGCLFISKFSEGEKFVIRAWGLTVLRQSGESEEDIYLPQTAQIEFEQTNIVKIDYGIYDSTKQAFLPAGESTENTNLCLVLGKEDNRKRTKPYLIGGCLGRYIGFGEIEVYCTGAVSLIYDEAQTISAEEYCLNPGLYAFPEISREGTI